jgi:hypothetical protein
MCTKQKLLGKAFQFIQINQAVPNQKHHIGKVGIEPAVYFTEGNKDIISQTSLHRHNTGHASSLEVLTTNYTKYTKKEKASFFFSFVSCISW